VFGVSQNFGKLDAQDFAPSSNRLQSHIDTEPSAAVRPLEYENK
jgi:hypothetical protein